jgi:hypothetical protein
VGKLEEKRRHGVLGEDGTITLEIILEKLDGDVWTGLT